MAASRLSRAILRPQRPQDTKFEIAAIALLRLGHLRLLMTGARR